MYVASLLYSVEWNVINIVTGYNRILSSLGDIIETLKLNSGARDKLTSLYQKHKWLSISAKPVEDDLVKLALDRIKQDPSQFDMLISMLNKIEGMDLIVKTLTGGKLSSIKNIKL